MAIMNMKKWFENWDMTSLKLKTSFAEMEWKPNISDEKAAWELYIELLTRVTTQSIFHRTGDEAAALESVYELFPITRKILKDNTRDCEKFSKVAIIVLNQVIRPFTSKWHKALLQDKFKDKQSCNQFRLELIELQSKLKNYTLLLANIAGVEDLTDLDSLDS
jgi:hypothetical protein